MKINIKLLLLVLSISIMVISIGTALISYSEYRMGDCKNAVIWVVMFVDGAIFIISGIAAIILGFVVSFDESK